MNRLLTSVIILILVTPIISGAQVRFQPHLEHELEFPRTYVGESSHIALIVTGSDEIEDEIRISIRLLFDPDENGEEGIFTADPTDFGVGAGEEVVVDLAFSPDETGMHFRMMDVLVSSEDPEDPDICYQVELSGEGVAPQIIVEPRELEFWCYTGDNDEIFALKSEDQLRIGNADIGVLRIESIESDVDWLEIEPTELEVLPEHVVEVTVSVIDPLEMEGDLYEAVISIHSNDPDNETVAVNVSFMRDFVIEIPDPPPGEPWAVHSIIIEEARIGGELLDPGDEIGVFTPGGVFGGYVRIRDVLEPFPVGLTALGDDLETEEIDGFRAGEEFEFRIWDSSLDMEFQAEIVQLEGRDYFCAHGLSILSLATEGLDEHQEIRLRRGWNMISSARYFNEDYIDEEGPDVNLIMSPIEDELVIVKDGYGRFCAPLFEYWGIPAWNTGEGYQVKVTAGVYLPVRGEQIPGDRPIILEAGWNMIAYYPEFETQFLYACGNIIDHVLIAKDVNGNYWVPDWGWWWWLPMEQGQGYLVKVDEDCELVYPGEPDDNVNLVLHPHHSTEHFPAALNTGSNMSVLITDLEFAGQDAGFRGELACLTSQGLIAGAVPVSGPPPWGLPVWGDDPTTDEIDGFRRDEPMQFVYWDEINNQEISVAIICENGMKPVYETDDFQMLSLKNSKDFSAASLPRDLTMSSLVPNPFNSMTSLQFEQPGDEITQISLYNLTGRKIRTLVDRKFKAGAHSISIDLTGMPAGMYIVGMTSGARREYMRAVLLR